jgi:hypothetical protein
MDAPSQAEDHSIILKKGKFSNMISYSSSGKDGTKAQCDAGGKAECWQTGFKIEQAQEMHFAGGW